MNRRGLDRRRWFGRGGASSQPASAAAAQWARARDPEETRAAAVQLYVAVGPWMAWCGVPPLPALRTGADRAHRR